jgi:hypothetical protein
MTRWLMMFDTLLQKSCPPQKIRGQPGRSNSFESSITGEQPYRFVLHDRDNIYSTELDYALKSLEVIVLRTPFRAPQANSFCARLVGTIRRECLDFLIVIQRAMRHTSPETKRRYQLGMVEQVREAMERANQQVYGDRDTIQ